MKIIIGIKLHLTFLKKVIHVGKWSEISDEELKV